MTNGITQTTHKFSTPYLTVQEFKDAPTAIDIDNLVFNTIDPDAQDAELANVIARASSWIDTYCNQILGATSETEQQRSRIRPDGTIRFHPRYNPIIALTQFKFGTDFSQMVTYPDCSNTWIEDNQIIVPYAWSYQNYTSQGPLQFGFPYSQQAEVFLNYTYVNGYANSEVVTAVAGQSTLTLKSGIGITAGLMMKIYDGFKSENITVADSYVFGSRTVPITYPLDYDHNPGISVSALPPAVKEAAILVTTAMLKVRGDNSMTMAVGTLPSQATPQTQNIGSDMGMAMDLLKPYRRIR
jgi:hypothetical protein